MHILKRYIFLWEYKIEMRLTQGSTEGCKQDLSKFCQKKLSKLLI